MKKTFICEGCPEPCYLTVVSEDGEIGTPVQCPFQDYANWCKYRCGDDDE